MSGKAKADSLGVGDLRGRSPLRLAHLSGTPEHFWRNLCTPSADLFAWEMLPGGGQAGKAAGAGVAGRQAVRGGSLALHF